MATMNKPTYAAIQSYSPSKPVLVFVSSRRQTRLTALDLIAFAAADMKPDQWLHMSERELEKVRPEAQELSSVPAGCMQWTQLPGDRLELLCRQLSAALVLLACFMQLLCRLCISWSLSMRF
jgi:hypothetical protein